MTLKETLKRGLDSAYGVTESLFHRVDANQLDWKPSSGRNWMTTGQLVMHCTNACGTMFKGFVSGDWGMPEGMTMDNLSPEEMLPPAEKMPAVESVEQALVLLKEDKAMAEEYLARADEEDLLSQMSPPPWGGPEMTLYEHLLSSVEHLNQHKGQLFYYLKLQGQPVNTQHLWGM